MLIFLTKNLKKTHINAHNHLIMCILNLLKISLEYGLYQCSVQVKFFRSGD